MTCRWDWYAIAWGAALMLWACSCVHSPLTYPEQDATTEDVVAQTTVDASTCDQIVAVDATPTVDSQAVGDCGAGYHRVVYSPVTEVYCAPDDATVPQGDAPCGSGYIARWHGEGIVMCRWGQP